MGVFLDHVVFAFHYQIPPQGAFLRMKLQPLVLLHQRIPQKRTFLLQCFPLLYFFIKKIPPLREFPLQYILLRALPGQIPPQMECPPQKFLPSVVLHYSYAPHSKFPLQIFLVLLVPHQIPLQMEFYCRSSIVLFFFTNTSLRKEDFWSRLSSLRSVYCIWFSLFSIEGSWAYITLWNPLTCRWTLLLFSLLSLSRVFQTSMFHNFRKR